jgi:predicted oxidoreductase
MPITSKKFDRFRENIVKKSRVTIALSFIFLLSCGRPGMETKALFDAEVIIVGAGIAGLSAAVEMGRQGVSVLVLDMNSVVGGHAVMAGGFAIVDTPIQLKDGFADSPDTAYADWMEWTQDGDPDWTRFYAENSREMIYDFAVEMGVEFVRVQAGHENSVPRFHFTSRGAIDFILALYRTALQLPTVSFKWNQKVDDLILENGVVHGVVTRNTRSSHDRSLYAPHVILATGGFEGNLERVLDNWRSDLPKPDRLLIGASVHADGNGLDLAGDAGAGMSWINRHYIYTNGMLDPMDPEGTLAITVSNDDSVWLNGQGKRFTNENGYDKRILVDLLEQNPTHYFAIFDETSKNKVSMRGREWIKDYSAGHPILDNPNATYKADSLEELAAMIGLSVESVITSVTRFNFLIDAGVDMDFRRFDSGDETPPKIERAPFYAIQFFPMSRKSMGGVAVDIKTRVLNAENIVISGLYAVGELTGSVGINGTHGMDGMFLGPSVVTGRVAARTIIKTLSSAETAFSIKPRPPEQVLPDLSGWEPSLTAEYLKALLENEREGYWHFHVSHSLVLDWQYECTLCHSAQVPFYSTDNTESKLAQSLVCANCHGRGTPAPLAKRISNQN